MSQTKKARKYQLTETVGRYPSETVAWYLVEIPEKISQQIYSNFSQRHRGFGSLPVLVTLRKTAWRTSIFCSKRTNTYLLFLKAAIRKKERIEVGDKITLSICIDYSSLQ